MRTRAAADLTTLAAQYVEHLRSRRYSSSSIEKAHFELGRLTRHLRAATITDARAVTEAHLAAYARMLAEHQTRAHQLLAPTSRASALSVVRRFFAWLEARAIVLHNCRAGRRRACIRGWQRASTSRRSVIATRV